MLSAAHHALREAKNPAHEGQKFRLVVDASNGRTYVGEVVDCDTETLVLSGDLLVFYINHAHIVAARIIWL